MRGGCEARLHNFSGQVMVLVDEVIREMKSKAGSAGVEMCADVKRKANIALFADDTVLIEGNGKDLENLVNTIHTVSKRGKLKEGKWE